MQVQSNFQQPLQIRPLNERVYKQKPKLETYNPIAHFQQKFDIDHTGFIQKQNGLQFGNFSTVDYGGGSKIVNQKSDYTFKFQFPRHFKSNRPQVFSNPITGESIDFKQKKPLSFSNRASPRQSVNLDSTNKPQQTNQKSVFIESAFQQLSSTDALSFDFMKAQQTFKKNARRDIFRDPINGREIKFNLPKQIIGSLDNQRIQVKVDPVEITPQANALLWKYSKRLKNYEWKCQKADIYRIYIPYGSFFCKKFRK